MEWLIAKKAFEDHKRGQRFQAVVDERMANLILQGYVERLEEPALTVIGPVTPRSLPSARLANPRRSRTKPDGQG